MTFKVSLIIILNISLDKVEPIEIRVFLYWTKDINIDFIDDSFLNTGTLTGNQCKSVLPLYDF